MILTGSARRRYNYPLPEATEVHPYSPTVVCTIPTYDGSGATIHPSVVDIGYRWHGYRWWMANTPWPDGLDSYENPSIWGSNDRETWVVPEGLTNPIEPYPGIAGYYNSDTELVWDSENNRLVCFWRWVGGGLDNVRIRARASSDGSTWSDMYDLFTPPSYSTSPTVFRLDGKWIMVQANAWGQPSREATDLLGPWEIGRAFTSPIAAGYHGFAANVGDKIISATTSAGAIWLAVSDAGTAWEPAVQLPVPGVIDNAYRATFRPSTKAGWLDVWHSGTKASLTGGRGVAYTRVPLSALGLG